MMQFLRYITNEKSTIASNFLLPFEQKLIYFNESGQRQLRDDRDKCMLIGNFLFVKVMAGKLFFKPYKVTRFFEQQVSDMENPEMFKENCLSIAYSFVAMMTDLLFDLYKVEMERIEGQSLKKAKDIAAVKQKIFKDLMPISDSFVQYKDFEAVSKTSEWTALVAKIRAMVNKTIEMIKQHKHLSDQGLQVRAQEDLNELIKIRTKQFNDLKRKIAHDREERLIRE